MCLNPIGFSEILVKGRSGTTEIRKAMNMLKNKKNKCNDEMFGEVSSFNLSMTLDETQ